MKIFHLVRRSLADKRGSTVIEFAILGPTLIAMLMGILWVGLQMQKYNALRSIAADVNRYTVVEYQKSNKLVPQQIEDVAASIAIRPPYELSGDRLDIDVTQENSPVAGAKKFALTLQYTPHDFLSFIGVRPVNLAYDQNIFVPQ